MRMRLWSPSQTWLDRRLELRRVLSLHSSRIWGALLVWCVVSLCFVVVSVLDYESPRYFVWPTFLAGPIILMKALDARIYARRLWSNALDDPELVEVLLEHGMERVGLIEIPRDLIAMRQFKKGWIGGRVELLTVYASRDMSRVLALTGQKAGDSYWDLVAAQRGQDRGRSFRIYPKLRRTTKSIPRLSGLYKLKGADAIPSRLVQWLVAQRPQVEIDVQGSWSTCRFVRAGRLQQTLPIPELRPVHLQTLLITVSSVSVGASGRRLAGDAKLTRCRGTQARPAGCRLAESG